MLFQVKIIERVLDSVVQSQVEIDNMQLRFMPGCVTANTIFTLQQLQENHLEKHKPIYFAFVCI